MKKMSILVLMMFLSLLIMGPVIHANYNYSPYNEAIESASSMTSTSVINASTLLDESGNLANIAFGELKQIYAANGFVYVVDQSLNRVYILNENYRLVSVFPSEAQLALDENYRLNKPAGVYVFNDSLYIADTDNERILVVDLTTMDIVLEVKNPQDPTFDDLKFKPHKVVVDRTGRMYVIALDVFEGIMDFNSDGSFSRFVGTNRIQMSFLEALIYRLSSQIQRERQALRLQATFNSIDIDSYGYLYTVSRPDSFDVIKKLNFKGFDILNRGGYVLPVGDVEMVRSSRFVPTGRSHFIDIAVSKDDYFYSALDMTRGRIFTYDNEGNLLYIFGELGNQANQFRKPESLTYVNDQIWVTDSLNRSIVIFEPTPFGQLINQGVSQYMQSDYDSAKDTWEDVLRLNSNYFLAYAGIGKAQLRSGDYEEAMVNLRLGFDYYNYSMAYEQHRTAQLENVLPYLLVVFLLGATTLFGLSLKNAVKREREEGE